MPEVMFSHTTVEITDVLAANGRVVGPDGAGIAAAIWRIGCPSRRGHPEHRGSGYTPRSPDPGDQNHYTFGADVDISTPMTQPFILALPLPPNTDPTHLALSRVDPTRITARCRRKRINSALL